MSLSRETKNFIGCVLFGGTYGAALDFAHTHGGAIEYPAGTRHERGILTFMVVYSVAPLLFSRYRMCTESFIELDPVPADASDAEGLLLLHRAQQQKQQRNDEDKNTMKNEKGKQDDEEEDPKEKVEKEQNATICKNKNASTENYYINAVKAADIDLLPSLTAAVAVAMEKKRAKEANDSVVSPLSATTTDDKRNFSNDLRPIASSAEVSTASLSTSAPASPLPPPADSPSSSSFSISTSSFAGFFGTTSHHHKRNKTKAKVQCATDNNNNTAPTASPITTTSSSSTSIYYLAVKSLKKHAKVNFTEAENRRRRFKRSHVLAPWYVAFPASALLYTSGYLLTAYGWNKLPSLAISAALAVPTLYCFKRWDGTLHGLLAMVTSGLCGASFEAFLNTKVQSMTYQTNDIFGIPYWLFWVYALNASTFGQITRFLLEPKHRQEVFNGVEDLPHKWAREFYRNHVGLPKTTPVEHEL